MLAVVLPACTQVLDSTPKALLRHGRRRARTHPQFGFEFGEKKLFRFCNLGKNEVLPSTSYIMHYVGSHFDFDILILIGFLGVPILIRILSFPYELVNYNSTVTC